MRLPVITFDMLSAYRPPSDKSRTIISRPSLTLPYHLPILIFTLTERIVMLATQDTDLLATISDVVKSWIGFRPTGCFLETFTHGWNGVERTVKQANAHLNQWVENQIISQTETDEMDRWAAESDAEIARTSWLPG